MFLRVEQKTMHVDKGVLEIFMYRHYERNKWNINTSQLGTRTSKWRDCELGYPAPQPISRLEWTQAAHYQRKGSEDNFGLINNGALASTRSAIVHRASHLMEELDPAVGLHVNLLKCSYSAGRVTHHSHLKGGALSCVAL